MALLDFLKKKKEKDKAKEKKSPKVLDSSKSEKAEASPIVRTIGLNKNEGKFSYNVVREPHISEKATDLSEKNKYTFKVYSNTNKPEIKKSVEGI